MVTRPAKPVARVEINATYKSGKVYVGTAGRLTAEGAVVSHGHRASMGLITRELERFYEEGIRYLKPRYPNTSFMFDRTVLGTKLKLKIVEE